MLNFYREEDNAKVEENVCYSETLLLIWASLVAQMVKKTNCNTGDLGLI